MKKIAKKSQKVDVFDDILKDFRVDFVDWLYGINEDDPIPGETKNVYIILEFNQNFITISYSTDERVFDTFDYGMFCPLEAQCFLSSSIVKLSNIVFSKKSKSKKYIFDLLKQNILSISKEVSFFKDKRIFVGERFKKVFV